MWRNDIDATLTIMLITGGMMQIQALKKTFNLQHSQSVQASDGTNLKAIKSWDPASICLSGLGTQ